MLSLGYDAEIKQAAAHINLTLAHHLPSIVAENLKVLGTNEESRTISRLHREGKLLDDVVVGHTNNSERDDDIVPGHIRLMQLAIFSKKGMESSCYFPAL